MRPSLSLLVIVIVLVPVPACRARNTKSVCSSSCGDIHNISHPFRLDSDPEDCGDHRYTLSCENNKTVLHLQAGKYYVQAINYNKFIIRLVDAAVLEHDCSTIPAFSLGYGNLSLLRDPYSPLLREWYNGSYEFNLNVHVIFMKCANPHSSENLGYNVVDPGACKFTNSKYSYVKYRDRTSASDVLDSCSVERVVMATFRNDTENYFGVKYEKNKSYNYNEVHRAIAFGFELSWLNAVCPKSCTTYCSLNYSHPDDITLNTGAARVACSPGGGYYTYRDFGIPFLGYWRSPQRWPGTGLLGSLTNLLQGMIYVGLPYTGFLVAIIQVVKFVFGIPCLMALLVYKWRRRHLSVYDTIEEFLQSRNNLTPIRYSYSEIKKMTKNFQDKLGEGGFGSVYKGKLRSGRVAAIKMLSESKANGQDFMSEVATIGRIRHINIVQLIGFCADGSKRALVYDFMPNGSLDKYIFSREESICLSWRKLYEISLGVAQGIQYIHQGCDMQILHFDIKPHNILLDENFIPKVSDFGLAKLYSTNDSIASLTAARGTIGYMAPELFYKNIGRISYKADVYSFGMLLLDMAGKRKKKLTPSVEKSSQMYFPFWVHDEVSKGKVTEIDSGTEEEMDMVKKMITVGLWCIQMKPSDRPPMSKVVEMLEGDLESLPLPPRPVLYPEENMAKDETGEREASTPEISSEWVSSGTYASSTQDAKEIVDAM